MENILWEIIAPCIMIACDCVTGYIAAMYMGTVDSKKMKSGIYGKLGELFAIALGFFLEFAVGIYGADMLGVPASIPIGVSVCAYVFLTELVSVIENIGCMNPKIGAKLVEILGIKPEKVNLVVKEGDEDGSDE